MDCFDYVIVGAGPAGVSAAYALRGKSVLVLDVGYTPKKKVLANKNLYELKETEKLHSQLLGKNFEFLESFSLGYLSPKLKGPLMRYITKLPETIVGLDNFNNFDAQQSFAKGGLANAWGAGLMRYLDSELRDFPISSKDLDPYYDELTEVIGISGDKDDLSDYFGSTKKILPPLRLSQLGGNFLKKYQAYSGKFSNLKMKVGRPRLAVLSENYKNRPAYQYLNQDFFEANNPSIFNPAYLLDDLIERNLVTYRENSLVSTFFEKEGLVEVNVTDLKTNESYICRAKKLILAAGTLNTSRIVLNSYNDREARLPILDNPICFIPFLDFSLIGKRFQIDAFPGAELSMLDCSSSVQASVYGLSGTLRGDLIAEFPLSIKSNITLTKFLSAALGMVQVFFPDTPSIRNSISLNEKGGLNIDYQKREDLNVKSFLSYLYRLRYFTSSFIVKKPLPGSSIHYAGSFPMRQVPTAKYETDINCKLALSSNVHIVDASVFPSLPSKNHSFTIMANSMRVASSVSK